MQPIYRKLTHFFLCTLSLPFQVHAESAWDALRHEFKLNHHLEQASVQKELRWLREHPKYLAQLTAAKPYLFHILTEVKKQQLPGELALIPMLESAYNPFAYSKVGAAGLWQLMPKTGQHLGVHGSWWADDRRNIEASTIAALRYFNHLHRFFHGDWLLAIAAYDCGEGTVQRMQARSNGPSNFWQLPLPDETLHYVPRLLALAELIAHAKDNNISLPNIPFQPYFTSVVIPSTIDLNHAARLVGISFHDFIHLNPGLNHSTTSPVGNIRVLIPEHRLHYFQQNIAKLPQQAVQGLQPYRVKLGDNLEKIAIQFHSNPVFIAKLNHLKAKNLSVGQVLYLPMPRNDQLIERYLPSPSKKIIPSPKLICPKAYKILHLVQPGETLNGIAHQYGISLADLRQWNKTALQQPSTQQKLWIWKFTDGQIIYTVKPGDTLAQIARQHHLTLPQLQHLNPRLKLSMLKPGENIKVLQ